MSRRPPADPGAAVDGAVRALSRLRAKSDEARATLAGLEEAVEIAEGKLDALDVGKLQEANELLVLSNLKAQENAESCVEKLSLMTRYAELDVLTELPDRDVLMDRFGHAIAVAKRSESRVALLFVDLDQFKNINDTLGHSIGDSVLRQTAHCL